MAAGKTWQKLNWQDPFLLQQQLTDEQRMVQESARQYARERLLRGVDQLAHVLARLGVVTAGQLLRGFRWAVLGIFVTAAIITPTPDIATQTVFAVPMILLYLLGILVAAVFGRKEE